LQLLQHGGIILLQTSEVCCSSPVNLHRLGNLVRLLGLIDSGLERIGQRCQFVKALRELLIGFVILFEDVVLLEGPGLEDSALSLPGRSIQLPGSNHSIEAEIARRADDRSNHDHTNEASEDLRPDSRIESLHRFEPSHQSGDHR